MTKSIIAKKQPQPKFLPMTRKEMDKLGWDRPDIILVSGDSYIDHPSFGIPLLGRVLSSHGFKVALICQPDWNDPKALAELGRPRLYAGVSAGALDSMVAHYTSFRKKRSDDAYTPGGKAGARPNRACIIYTNLIKKAFKGLPVIIGGIEASLRRISHYDFWTDKVRKPILMDSKADLLVYGMGERAMLDAALRLSAAEEYAPAVLKGIPGTAFMGTPEDIPNEAERIELPSHQAILDDPQQLMNATLALEEQVHFGDSWAIQPVDKRHVVLAQPSEYLSTEELDWLYSLPYARLPHPIYKDKGRIPAADMIEFSITSHRGCGGGCSFCSIAMHQGRHIRSRSRKSIMDELKRMQEHPDFRGSVSDIGGPSANMWNAHCSLERGKCKRKSCLVPKVCPNFKYDQQANLKLYRDARKMDGIKHVRVASGVRFDLGQQNKKSLKEIFKEFVGGQLKVAPEHITPSVLKHMRKPDLPIFESFLEMFASESKKAGKEQYVIPYLMSAFPGCTDSDMRQLGSWLAARGWKPRQVQCFIPTPGTVATAMFYCETDPAGNKIYVAKTDAQRLKQHRILIPDPGRDPRAGRQSGKQGGKHGKKKPFKEQQNNSAAKENKGRKKRSKPDREQSGTKRPGTGKNFNRKDKGKSFTKKKKMK
ncbi:YgiQ family radical SAM protein [Desulfovibrio sp. JC010]|uniref:YgiQ family radical SAM protein n=1 Tax=Desulfovibrio sp. JC010 TaxID=2593641 RepID=UPI0013D1BBA1|nr:YgiQ family radical SAM protein [Desulfovibrio sp. JC010]NDV27279.1 YgiQ family radical SAM protein [Desulfovibrio sp. JC010]